MEIAGRFAAENLVIVRSPTPEFVATSRSSTLANTRTCDGGKARQA